MNSMREPNFLSVWSDRIDELVQQMRMLELSRPHGLWGIAVDRDSEALLWQKSVAQMEMLFAQFSSHAREARGSWDTTMIEHFGLSESLDPEKGESPA